MVEATRTKARRSWDSGDYLTAGRLLYDCLRVDERPRWASSALDVAREIVGSLPEVDELVALASAPERWPQARAIFDRLRQLTLRCERQEDGDLRLKGLLYLAENAAKVIYNASRAPAPYDHDAGWWIVSCLAHLLDVVGTTPEIRDRAWRAISAGRVS